MKKISLSLVSIFLVSACSIDSVTEPVKVESSSNLKNELKSVTKPTVTKKQDPVVVVTPKVTESKATQIISIKDKKVNIAQDYNTEKILLGLQSEKDLTKATEILNKYNLKQDNFIKGINTISVSSNGQNVPDLLNKLDAEKFFAFVETDNISSNKPEKESDVIDKLFSIFSVTSPVNDKYYKDQYALTALNVPAAWNLSTGKNTTIAIIDSGVDFAHGDLKNKILAGYDAFAKKEGSKGGNASKLNYVSATYKHGSHVAGIAAAEINNSKGIAGVAPDAKILPVAIFPEIPELFKTSKKNTDGSDITVVSAIADGIVWATDHKADVINMSLGVWEPSITLEKAVQYALDHNVSVVVAAGNERSIDNKRNYLAAIKGVIAVGATDINNNITSFSNSGDYVTVAAPGMDIISTTPSILYLKEYRKMSGTSMAAPHIAGIVALLKSKFGEKATPHWIKERLEETATDLGVVGRDDFYGKGLVNAEKALNYVDD